ncbi:hypothetical protein DFH06DRAFT_1473531 [Mycena polygramma]|nr:hypothetical protein DFH06DRAFT_1473531 [Mycena polygramma]
MKTLLLAVLSAAAFAAVCLASEVEIEPKPEPCTIRAWVRAEDLSPDHISHGELRIKVPRAECANQIASVALRLQLDEFGEFKFLKEGAVLPEVRPSNQSAPSGFADWTGSDVVYDYQAHDDGLTNPELWTVKAEERRAWTTQATLLESNPDLSQPIVTPFTVAVPAVNYPPVVNRYRQLFGPIARHSYSDIAYRYIAIVTFIDGRIESVQAGHTTFVPTSGTRMQQIPFNWTTTFKDPDCNGDSAQSKKRADGMERCLPEAQRSVFVGEVTLEEGSVVQTGQSLKGRVTVRQIKAGSTAMSYISINLRTLTLDRWAQAQALAGGDAKFHNATHGVCVYSGGDQSLDAESWHFQHIFEEKETYGMTPSFDSGTDGALTPAQPYIDFELQIPHDAPIDFASYYSTPENYLHFRLDVVYSPDVAKCMSPGRVEPPEEETTDDAAKTEEGLWDTFTRIGAPVRSRSWERTMNLQALMPITVVGRGSSREFTHYLTPGSPAPVLQSGAQAEMPTSFPVLDEPAVTVEALVDTSARLLQSGTTDPAQHMAQFMNRSRSWSAYPDPARNYRGGAFAGLLWKKKIVAEQRGILPLRSPAVDGGDAQQPFFAL